MNNRADDCVAPGCGVLNGVSGIPGDLPEYATLPSHAGLCGGGLTLSLATRGIKMENVYYKKVEVEEVMVKELSIEKEMVDVEKTKVQEQIAETLGKGKVLRNGDDKDQKASSEEPEAGESSKDRESNYTPEASGSSEIEQTVSKVQEVLQEEVRNNENFNPLETEESRLGAAVSSLRSGNEKIQSSGLSEERLTLDAAGSNKDGESNKPRLKLLQTGEISPKTAVLSLEEGNNILEQSTSVVTLLSGEENTRGASVSSEIKQKTSENDKPSLELLQPGEIIPKTTVLSLDEAKIYDGCEIEQTTALFVEEDKPEASGSLEIDQTTSKVEEVFHEEDRDKENSRPLESGGSKSEPAMTSSRSGEKIQNSGSSEEMTPISTVLFLDTCEVEQTTTLFVEEDKPEASGSLEIDQTTSKVEEVFHEEDRDKENSSPLESGGSKSEAAMTSSRSGEKIQNSDSSEEMTPKSTVLSLDTCEVEQTTTLFVEEDKPEASGSLEIDQTTSKVKEIFHEEDRDKENSSPLESGGSKPEAAMTSSRSGEKIQNSDSSEEMTPKSTVLSLDTCEVEQTTTLFVEEDKPEASGSLEIDQTTSKVEEVFHEEDRDKENSSPLESGGSKSEAAMTSSRSGEKIQNSGSSEEMPPKTTVLSLEGKNNNPEISDPYGIQQAAAEGASLPVEEDKFAGAPSSLPMNQEPSEVKKAFYKENASSSSGPLQIDSTSVTVTSCMVNRNDVIENSQPPETVSGCSKQSLTQLQTEHCGSLESRKRLRNWSAVTTELQNIPESFSFFDFSKNKKVSRIKEQNVPLVNDKKPGKKAARKLRRKLLAQQRQSERFQGQGVQENSGNLPRIQQNISISKGNQLIVPKQEILSDNEQILPENQGVALTSKKIFVISKDKLIRKQRMLPKNPGNLPKNPGNYSSNRINQGYLPSSQGSNQRSVNLTEMQNRIQEKRSENQQHPPLNQGNFSDVPSTSREADIPQNSSGSCSGKRKRNFENSSSQGAQRFKRPRHSERDFSSMKLDLKRVILTDNYRRVGITEQELGQIRIAISQEIDRIQEGPIPRFTNAYLQFGGIIIESADMWSRDWLTYIVPKLWTRTKLRVVDLSNLEKFYKAAMWIPGPFEDPDFILRRLEKQNPSLKTAAWRIHFGEEQFTRRGYNVFLGIPESSARALKEINCKPFLGLTRVTISISKQEDPEGQGFSF